MGNLKHKQVVLGARMSNQCETDRGTTPLGARDAWETQMSVGPAFPLVNFNCYFVKVVCADTSKSHCATNTSSVPVQRSLPGRLRRDSPFNSQLLPSCVQIASEFMDLPLWEV